VGGITKKSWMKLLVAYEMQVFVVVFVCFYLGIGYPCILVAFGVFLFIFGNGVGPFVSREKKNLNYPTI
jgi:hypothetical protein